MDSISNGNKSSPIKQLDDDSASEQLSFLNQKPTKTSRSKSKASPDEALLPESPSLLGSPQSAPPSLISGSETPSAPLATPANSAVTVGELTRRIKGKLERDIGTIWVKGEISNFKPSSSGHIYFNLKDSEATVGCALFKGVKLGRFQLKDGLEVLVRGRLSVYAPRGNYQLIVEAMEPVGLGALQLAFEQLKAKLSAEGLFSPERKRPIPAHPKRIVLITSPTGAVLQDMLRVLGRRNAGISLLIVPTPVQGDDAIPKICQALAVANHFRLGDVIILARGGGSIEDLWCFNSEQVVRAVASSVLPVISAIGHEVDFTLCDFAADLRAPTPSAAAEIVAKSRLELLEQSTHLKRRMYLVLTRQLSLYRHRLAGLEAKLVGPSQRLTTQRAILSELEMRMHHAMKGAVGPLMQAADEFTLRLNHAIDVRVSDQRRQLEVLTAQLEALSPLKVLGRGYTVVRGAKKVVRTISGLSQGEEIDLQFYDGSAKAKILDIKPMAK